MLRRRDISGFPGVRCNRVMANVLRRNGTRRNDYPVGAAGQPFPTMSSRCQPTVAKPVALYRPKTLQPPSNNRWLFSHNRLRSSLQPPTDRDMRCNATLPASKTEKLSRVFHISHNSAGLVPSKAMPRRRAGRRRIKSGSAMQYPPALISRGSGGEARQYIPHIGVQTYRSSARWIALASCCHQSARQRWPPI